VVVASEQAKVKARSDLAKLTADIAAAGAEDLKKRSPRSLLGGNVVDGKGTYLKKFYAFVLSKYGAPRVLLFLGLMVLVIRVVGNITKIRQLLRNFVFHGMVFVLLLVLVFFFKSIFTEYFSSDDASSSKSKGTTGTSGLNTIMSNGKQNGSVVSSSSGQTGHVSPTPGGSSNTGSTSSAGVGVGVVGGRIPPGGGGGTMGPGTGDVRRRRNSNSNSRSVRTVDGPPRSDYFAAGGSGGTTSGTSTTNGGVTPVFSASVSPLPPHVISTRDREATTNSTAATATTDHSASDGDVVSV
jgi:hypothetical protein